MSSLVTPEPTIHSGPSLSHGRTPTEHGGGVMGDQNRKHSHPAAASSSVAMKTVSQVS